MTSAVRPASESGMVRFGSFTSPAVNVMLFQASEEKSDPTWAAQIAMSRPKTPLAAVTEGMNDRSGLMGATSRGVQKSPKLAVSASELRPTRMPTTISAASDSVLADVKRFWMNLPSLSPRVLMNVSSTITTIAASCCVERLRAYRVERLIGGMIQRVGEIDGASAPRYRAKATATAAIVPV